MNLNTNDFVVVNGRKYYADGGDTNTQQLIPPADVENYINKYYEKNKNLLTGWGNEGDYTPSNFAKSNLHGMELYNSYSPEIQKMIATNRENWLSPLLTKYGDKIQVDENGKRYIVADDGYKVNIDDWLTTNYYDDENSQYVNGLMWRMYPGHIIGNYKKDSKGNILKDEKGNPIVSDDPKDNIKIPSGDNIFYKMLTAEKDNNLNLDKSDEWNELNDLGFGDYHNNANKAWTRYQFNENDSNSPVMYNFYDKNKEGKNANAYTLVYDPQSKTWSQYGYDNSIMNGYRKSSSRNISKDTKNIRTNAWANDYRQNGLIPIINGNAPGVKFNSEIANKLNWTGSNKAYGGPTTRLFASGGEMIPMGEQPDYNMVGAGGSHEMNPQGGVPYGINQDGSQNMVEQGEVSVGNNVFSNRTAISPELCQQLGLPEGTSPAQAMRQIQQLYEQGQIGDAEFQEIQQIIFDDQEAQKQNVGGSYQQGQVGGEGITPEMMQGQNIPPQAMPQQGAPEGIAPEMVQGGAYAFGGRRRC